MSLKKDRSSAGEYSGRVERRWVIQTYSVWRNRRFSPPTDVIELTDKLLVQIEIGGMRGSDFNIALLEHHLIISGVRPQPFFENPAFHQVEIGYGEFRIEVPLPWPVNHETVSAAYHDGFLQISLPRSETTMKSADADSSSLPE
jgi:HSP20 family protein